MAKHKNQPAAPKVKAMRQQTLTDFERREQATNELYMQFVSSRDSLVADLQGQAKAIDERLSAVKAIVRGK